MPLRDKPLRHRHDEFVRGLHREADAEHRGESAFAYALDFSGDGERQQQRGGYKARVEEYLRAREADVQHPAEGDDYALACQRGRPRRDLERNSDATKIIPAATSKQSCQ